MKTPLTILLTALAGALQGAVPVEWEVETSRAQPAQFDCYRGESLELRASLFSYGEPLTTNHEPPTTNH